MVPLCVGFLLVTLTQSNQRVKETHIWVAHVLCCFSICTHTCGVGLGVPAFEGGRAKPCSLHMECSRAVEPTSGNRELLLLGLSFLFILL